MTERKQERQVDPDFLRPKQVAERLGVAQNTVYCLCAAGIIPSVRLGKSILIPADGYKRYAEALKK